jgi:hypothetical protein
MEHAVNWNSPETLLFGTFLGFCPEGHTVEVWMRGPMGFRSTESLFTTVEPSEHPVIVVLETVYDS